MRDISIKGAVSKVRAITKWRLSNKIIGKIIRSSDDFKSRTRPWTKMVNIWLKRQKISPNLNNINHNKKLVYEEYKNRLNIRDKSEITKFTKNLNIYSSKKIRRLELNSCDRGIGYLTLTRLRTGTFPFTNRLVVSGRVVTTGTRVSVVKKTQKKM